MLLPGAKPLHSLFQGFLSLHDLNNFNFNTLNIIAILQLECLKMIGGFPLQVDPVCWQEQKPRYNSRFPGVTNNGVHRFQNEIANPSGCTFLSMIDATAEADGLGNLSRYYKWIYEMI